ncbi:hypothetical protein TBLA_0A05320 [Henningerozyma blattae CBS 6284]|uniref:Sterol 3-beta-glucosyltransferase n=1 Tax=Henningerozyma blattae (strain ATCC 34711 / CBS 6284 / DSM 70876 / NBRC 10599 / NRRL Y-10934 / UCD 77-7) TaxID=1071380 RepID=I2GW23_HENB6|nr:hypothetical protein TBLA_0A05320 [Tetrapisispora blattae CBS 6284]CCH58325.1 hypothetical protein TBLA_0A05320 [Tetrapisispora blattae CBS 6284]
MLHLQQAQQKIIIPPSASATVQSLLHPRSRSNSIDNNSKNSTLAADVSLASNITVKDSELIDLDTNNKPIPNVSTTQDSSSILRSRSKSPDSRFKKINKEALNLPLNSAKLVIKSVQRPASVVSEVPIGLTKGLSHVVGKTSSDILTIHEKIRSRTRSNSLNSKKSTLDSSILDSPTIGTTIEPGTSTTGQEDDLANSSSLMKGIVGLLTTASVYANMEKQKGFENLENDLALETDEETEEEEEQTIANPDDLSLNELHDDVLSPVTSSSIATIKPPMKIIDTSSTIEGTKSDDPNLNEEFVDASSEVSITNSNHTSSSSLSSEDNWKDARNNNLEHISSKQQKENSLVSNQLASNDINSLSKTSLEKEHVNPTLYQSQTQNNKNKSIENESISDINSNGSTGINRKPNLFSISIEPACDSLEDMASKGTSKTDTESNKGTLPKIIVGSANEDIPTQTLQRQLSKTESGISQLSPTNKLLEKFRETFNLSSDEKIIKNFSSWLLKDILIQGHMFVTKYHLLFFAFLPKSSGTVKLSGNLNVFSKIRGSSRYWCVLKDDIFTLYTSPTDLYFPAFTIDLRDVEDIQLMKNKKTKELTKKFHIITKSKKFKFIADSEYSAKTWYNTLKRQQFTCQNSENNSISIKIPLLNIIDISDQNIANEALTLSISVLESPKTYAVDDYIFVFLNGMGTNVKNALLLQLKQLGDLGVQVLYNDQERLQLLKDEAIELARDKERDRDDVISIISTFKNLNPLGGTISRVRSKSMSAMNIATTKPASPIKPSHLHLENQKAQTSNETLDTEGNTQEEPKDPIHYLNPQNNKVLKIVSPLLPSTEIENILTSASEKSYLHKIRPRSNSWFKKHDTSVEENINLTKLSTGHSTKLNTSGITPETSSKSTPAVLTDAPEAISLDQELVQSGIPSGSELSEIETPTSSKTADDTIVTTQGSRMSRISAPLKNLTGIWIARQLHYPNQYIKFDPNDKHLVKNEDEISDANNKFIEAFKLAKSEVLIASFYAYLNRSIPAYGRIMISQNFICFRSLLPGINMTMILPIDNINGTVEEKGFRFGYYGLVIVVQGNEELFFEVTSRAIRDDLNGLINKIREETQKTAKAHSSSYLINDFEADPEIAKLKLFEDKINASDGFDVPVMIDRSPYFNTNSRPNKSYKFGLLTIGSRGDVQPYIALARGLLKEGHEVIIITHKDFKEFVTSHSIGFEEIAGNPAELMALMVEHESINIGMLREASSKFRGWITELLDTSWEACKRNNLDILIESPSAMAGIHIAEAMQIPYYRAFTMPWTRTRAYPHAFIVPDQKRGGNYNYFTHVLFENIFWKGISGQINKWRVEKLKLEKTNLTLMQQNRVPFLYNVSPTIFPPAIDFSEWTKVTGYWFLDEKNEYEPPKPLVEFIRLARMRHKKLVYIGFGSIVVDNATEMTRAIVEAVKEADVFCILNKGWSDRLGDKSATTMDVELPNSIYNAGSVPHDWLFPQVDAAVHHGGSGTTGATLRAGLPTIIKPFFGDQYFYAMRVEEIGVGLSLKKLNSKSLSKALITVTTNKRMKAKAQLIQSQISKEDGVTTAINCIYGELEYARSLIFSKKRKSNGNEIKQTITAVTNAITTVVPDIRVEEPWTIL